MVKKKSFILFIPDHAREPDPGVTVIKKLFSLSFLLEKNKLECLQVASFFSKFSDNSNILCKAGAYLSEAHFGVPLVR